MLKKVFVPTDYSANSKSSVCFAINWATTQKLELVFIRVPDIVRPTECSDSYFEKYAEQNLKNL